ncbi:MAG: AIR synthase-related protein [Ilumatobacteraceae bacterium]
MRDPQSPVRDRALRRCEHRRQWRHSHILGAAHHPIACTDILCFGPADLPANELPDGVLHPRRIRSGVVAGVADYGNKIGLPTVAGGVLYDPAYTANPLVFAGCIGVADSAATILTGPHPGDRVIALGGRTGRDGLRGATFSSATMDATTGEVAGASVQIGDPITEKLVMDLLAEADGLFTSITDCGAGGFSSAVGEMAEGVGARVELSTAPLKYPGLSAWEIWLSEAQERMVLSVHPSRLPALQALCDRHGVELTDLGEFTGDNRLVVTFHGEVVLDLDTTFLHDGRPQRHMTAVVTAPVRQVTSPGVRRVEDPTGALLELLAHPNIASKAAVVHRYDHAIRGATLVGPLTGARIDGHSDGVVLVEPNDTEGFAIGIGVNPWHGLHDPYRMAFAAVDEAIRNAVAVGADPDRVALLDNFSWGDPRRPTTLGELDAAVDGCVDAAHTYGAPFVSGKDSLNNEYLGTDGERHAVPPTLVITAVAHVPDAASVVTSDLKQAGDLVVLVGATVEEFAGSHLDKVLGEPDVAGVVPAPDPMALDRFRGVHRAMRAGLVRACHDCSEGGLAVALAEMCIGGDLGVEVSELPHQDPTVAWFSESSSRLVCELAEADLEAFQALVPGALVVLGRVIAEPALSGQDLGPVGVETLRTVWSPR